MSNTITIVDIFNTPIANRRPLHVYNLYSLQCRYIDFSNVILYNQPNNFLYSIVIRESILPFLLSNLVLDVPSYIASNYVFCLALALLSYTKPIAHMSISLKQLK